MSGQTWTPAPKKGIIPLHPLTFGMLLGKAFAALRHNPKVLFGFGVVIQLVVVVLSASVMGFVFVTTFTRLESVSPSSPDFEAVFAGTIAMNIVAGIAVGLASVAFTALMQGVVAAEVGYAAIGVKASLRTLWRRMAPSFWRLAAFSSLSVLFVFGVLIVGFAIVAGALTAGGGGGELVGLAVILIVLLVLACIPLVVWLTTKLLLVPSILVLERARFREALVRSWRLTRGRFWVAWGVTFLISVIMGIAMQVVSFPVMMLSSMLGTVIAPTGSTDTGAVMGFVFALLAPQILLLVLQAITLVVQSTAGALVYLDCRMRYEGLDQALITHVERRDLGWTEDQLGDPFAVDAARAVTGAPPPKQVPEWAMAPTGYQAYPAQPYPAQPHPAQPHPGQFPPQQYPAQQYPAQQYPAQPYGAQPQHPGSVPAPPPYAPQPPVPPVPPPSVEDAPPAPPPAPAAAPAQDTSWTAPGSGGEGQA